MLFLGCNGKNTGEEAAGREVFGCCFALVGDRSAHFEAAGNLLRMISLNATSKGKVRRATQDEIELLVGFNHGRIPEIALANFVAMFDAIPLCGFAGESDAFFLGFYRDE